MSSVIPPGQPSDQLTIAIVGNDALIEALPARPIQFAHACQAAGFDLALPESWGDELVADTTLRKLEERRGSPAVLCACPLVRERLLASGVELAPLLINTAAPPVAVARYVRSLYGPRLAHLAYIGDCPAASGREYDAQHRIADFLRYLRDRGIDLLAQPSVFDAVLPPDRRRFNSLPGGCPTPEALWQHSDQRALVGLHSGGEEFAIELAEQLLTRQPVLVDVAPPLGCVCSGVTTTTTGHSARIAVMSLEPPRAPAPVIDTGLVPTLEEPVRVSPMDGGHYGRGGAPPINGSREPNVPGRPPIAITPPRALAVALPATREAQAGATRPVLTGGLALETVEELLVRETSRPVSAETAHGLQPPRTARPATRPVSGSIPTVRLTEPVVFRLPRAYLTRRRRPSEPVRAEAAAPPSPLEALTASRSEREVAAPPLAPSAPSSPPLKSAQPDAQLPGPGAAATSERFSRPRFASRVHTEAEPEKSRATRLLVRALIAVAILAVLALIVRQIL